MPKDVVLVTGASSAVGRALLSRLARQDATIYAHHSGGSQTGRSQDSGPESVGRGRLVEHVAKLEGPAEIHLIRADFASSDEVEAMVATIQERHGYANKIVHLAARPLVLHRFGQLDWAAWQADFDVSIRSITTILRAFLPAVARQEGVGGRAVFMLSSATVGTPPKSMSGYVTIKFALLGLMRALAVEYADKGIRVNAVSPYTMETPFLDKVPHKFAELTAAMNPAGRNATPDDVAPAIEFLLSPESGFINGANLPVTAGAAL